MNATTTEETPQQTIKRLKGNNTYLWIAIIFLIIMGYKAAGWAAQEGGRVAGEQMLKMIPAARTVGYMEGYKAATEGERFDAVAYMTKAEQQYQAAADKRKAGKD